MVKQCPNNAVLFVQQHKFKSFLFITSSVNVPLHLISRQRRSVNDVPSAITWHAEPPASNITKVINAAADS